MWYNVYNETGEFIGKIEKETEKLLKQGEYLRGVTCFVISKDGMVLIEERVNSGLTPRANDLCSGHVDRNEVFTQAMIRELGEELGLLPEQIIDKIMPLNKKEIPLDFNSKGKICSFFIKFFALIIPKNADDIIIKSQESELAGYKWVPMEEAFDLIRNGQTKFPYNQDPKKFEEIFLKVQELFRNEIVREKN